MSSDTGRAFGDTLSGGIQDVSALLPLLGTEQCERHVGSALDKGFLYAAATPLSIFGSLGIVKTAFATLLATTTYPFLGGCWLSDAGFKSSGTVSSLVTIKDGTAEYGAEVRLRDLLENQHIEDPELVSGVDWSGWETQVFDAETNAAKRVVPWNVKLLLASALGSLMSMTPYLYLISNQLGNPLAWLFPAFRSFGSFLCVVCIQLALQLRIHRIVQSRLLLMKMGKRNSGRSVGEKGLENELACFRKNRPKTSLLSFSHFYPRTEDLERAGVCESTSIPCETGEELEDPERQYANSLLDFDWILFLYQVVIAVGMGMVVAGYIGCFNLVGSSDVIDNGPYVWVGLESFLSLLRISLWGLNPRWDESTGLRLSLRLLPKETPLPSDTKGSEEGAPVPYYPLITTPTSLEIVDIRLYNPNVKGVTFVAHPESDFLGAATSYTGPLRRFKSDDISSLLYAVLDLGLKKKVLCTVIVLAHSRASICLVFDDSHSWAIASTYRLLPGTTTLFVTLQEIMDKTSISIPREVYDAVSKHARRLASRLFGPPRSQLDIKWDLSIVETEPAADEQNVVGPLTAHDVEYRTVKKQLWNDKSIFMRRRREFLWEDAKSDERLGERSEKLVVHTLDLFLFESVMLEMELCRKDHEFASRRASDKSLTRRLAPEWILGMQQRMDEEMRMIEPLCPTSPRALFVHIWNDLRSGLQLLRESENSVAVLRWMTDHIKNLKVPLESVEVPPVSFGDALGNRSLFQLWARISGAWASDAAEKAKSELDFRFVLFRLKTVLDHGFNRTPLVNQVLCSPLHFFQPYLALEEMSDYHFYGLSQSNIPYVLHLRWDKSPATASLDEILRKLASLDTMHQLTTLDVAHIPTTPELPSLLLDVLAKHFNVVALSCPRFEDVAATEAIQKRVSHNRAMWKERSRQRPMEFQYLVGFEADNPFGVDEESNQAWQFMTMTRTGPEEYWERPKCLTAERDVLHLHEGRVECLILVYAPTSGRVTFTFDALVEDYDTGSWSSDGVEVEVRYKCGTEGEWTCVSESEFTQRPQPAPSSVLRVALKLEGGDSEVRIRLSKNYSADDLFEGNVVRLRGLVGVEFSPD